MRYQRTGSWPPLYWPDQTNLSTQEEISPARPRLSAPDEQQGRTARASKPAPQGPGEAGLLGARRRTAPVEKAVPAAPAFGVPAGDVGPTFSLGTSAGRLRGAWVHRGKSRRRRHEQADQGSGPAQPGSAPPARGRAQLLSRT